MNFAFFLSLSGGKNAPASITYNWSEHYYTYDANGNLTGAPDFSDPFYIAFPRNAYIPNN